MAGNKITKINLNGVEYNLTDLSAQDRLDNVQTQVGGIVDLIPTKVSLLTNDSNFQTADLVDKAIQKIVGAAPEALDTLEEIAAKLEGNDDVIDAINGVLAGKADNNVVITLLADNKKEVEEWAADLFQPIGDYLTEHQDISGKVDKETGKGLSTNDYTNIEKTKLSGILEGAEVNQSTYSRMQIKNSDGQLKIVSADSKLTTFTLEVGENLIGSANGVNSLKLDLNIPEASGTKSGLMSADDKSKLDSVQQGAQPNLNAYYGMRLLNSDGTKPYKYATNTGSTFELELGDYLVGSDTGTLNTLKLDTNIPTATTSAEGLMSAEDKTKLDTLPNEAYSKDEIDAWKEGVAMKDSVVTSVAGKTGVVTLTKSDVGLGNVTNTSDMNKPVSTALLAAIDEVYNEIATVSADLDKHKQDPFKHLPDSSEKSGKVLTSSESNISQWKYLSEIIPNLEETVAYGVEWDITVPDPHLTRIGNLSLHKTLPIQSLLKGCIALGNKVIYWLDEDDWNYRSDHPSMDATVTELATDDTYSTFFIEVKFPTQLFETLRGVYNNLNVFLGQRIKIFENPEYPSKFTIEKIAKTSDTWYNEGYVTIRTNTYNGEIFGADSTSDSSIEFGSRLDGYDGTVRVYCPDFYIKSQIIGNKRRVWLSTVKLDSTWTYLCKILIDAYRSTVLRTVPIGMGYLSTLPVNSAISVVNTATYCRGGSNRLSYDKYLTGSDNTTIDIFRTDLGKPATSITRSDMRTYSRNAGSELLSYDLYKNIFYWLYVVEYANFNCLEAYNAELTEDGYHQGGMGVGMTDIRSGKWGSYNSSNPLTPCGYGNDLGNKTGLKAMTIPAVDNLVESTHSMARWRGFDNLFGDIYTKLDGIIIDADADNHPNDMNYVYTCLDPTKYADNLNDSYKKVGEEVHGSDYVYTKLFDLGDAAHIIPNVTGGNTTKYKCDTHISGNRNASLRTLSVGGFAYQSTQAGIGHFNTSAVMSSTSLNNGYRTVSFPSN